MNFASSSSGTRFLSMNTFWTNDDEILFDPFRVESHVTSPWVAPTAIHVYPFQGFWIDAKTDVKGDYLVYV